jgi:hypothetical protein
MPSAARKLKLVAMPARNPRVHVVSDRLLAAIRSIGELTSLRKRIDSRLEELGEDLQRLVAIEASAPSKRESRPEAPHAS